MLSGLTDLPLATDAAGQHTTGDGDGYSITVAAGQHLVVTCHTAGSGDTELYVKFGSEATRASYDLASPWNGGPDTALEVPSTQAGTYYVLAYADYVSGTVSYTIRADTDATLPTLTPGTAASGTLDHVYSFGLYQVTPGAGQHLTVQMHADNSGDDNELYVRQGSLPTLTTYDAAGKVSGLPDQYADMANTQGGPYYVLVRCVFDGTSSDGYTVRADTDATLPTLPALNQNLVHANDFAIYAVTPSPHQTLVVEVDGKDAWSYNIVYVRRGALPTSADYDAAGSTPNSPDQSVPLPQAAADMYYVVVRCTYWSSPGDHYDVRTNAPEVLPINQDTSGSLAQDGDKRYYAVSAPGGKHLKITLDDLDDRGVNELYVRYGDLPTAGVYDYRYSNLSGADQEILVSNATAGPWYVLVYGASVPWPRPGNYTIRADVPDMTIITSITPERHGNGAPATITVAGAGFAPSAAVALVKGAQTYPARKVWVVSGTNLVAEFAMAGIPPGGYSLRVTSAGSSAERPFQVTAGGTASLQTNLIIPAAVGRHANATLYVEYANTGDVGMPAPLLVLTGTERPLMSLNPSLVPTGFWTSARPEGFSDTVQILATGRTPGILQPGESCRAPVYFIGLQQPWDFSHRQVQFNLGVLAADNSDPVDWASLKDAMRPPTIRSDAWEAIWANFVAGAGSTWGHYVSMLDDNAAYLSRLDEQVVDVGELLAFEFQQADGLSPVRTPSGDVDAAVDAPGLPLIFARVYSEPISQRYEPGPLGRGWSHNWQMSLQQDGDGTVTVLGPAGSCRTFKPHSRAGYGYLSEPGDHGTLTALGGGAFSLREADGLQYVFRADGRLNYVEDPSANRITAGYDGAGRLTGLTHSCGRQLLLDYLPTGQLAHVIDPAGPGPADDRVATFSYSGEHLASAQEYDGRTTTYTYSAGQGIAREHALTIVDTAYAGSPQHYAQYFDYDAQGRLTATCRNGNAERLEFAYDSAGTVSVSDAVAGPTKPSRFYFDARGLLVQTQDALGSTVHLSFDPYYNLAAMTDPAGLSYTYGYDDRGNLIRSTDPLGHTTRFTYSGAFNRLSTVADADDHVTRYAYDARGNLLSITYADGKAEHWAYDSHGNPTAWTNRRGNEIGYTYDADGRITSKIYPGGGHVDYAYDGHGNLTSATDATGASPLVTAFAYDGADRLTRIDYPGGQFLQFTYAAGRRASSVDQLGHRLDYHYDAVGRLESLTDESAREVVHYTYDAAGRLSRKDLGGGAPGDGVYTTYEYDDAGQLVHLVNYKADGSVLSHFDYAYDSRGRRTSMNTSYGLWTYEYDDTGQLTHAALASSDPAAVPNQDLGYKYDAVGNRLLATENGTTTAYVANNMNQYTRVGDTTYEYDDDGNLIRATSPGGTADYTYDVENRLVGVASPQGSWQYAYDPFGNRAAATENGVTTRYVVDPIGLGNVVGEYGAAGALIAHYDHGFGLLARTAAGGNPAYYLFDALGSTQQVSSAGTAVDSYAYDPFGKVIAASGAAPNPFQYVGELGVMKEGNGLCYMRDRYYDANLGRFLGPDPLRPSGLNGYAYAAGNPVSLLDPQGLDSQDSSGWSVVLAETYYVAKQYGYDVAVRWLERAGSESYWLRVGLNWAGEEFAHFAATGTGKAIKEGALLGGAHVALRAAMSYWHVYANYAYNAVSNIKIPFLPWLSKLSLYGAAAYLGYRLGEILGNALYDLLPWDKILDSFIAGAMDPNEKSGPAGFGDARCIAPATPLAYRIDFENESSAGAPAQAVHVTDPLDSDLDWTSFELTGITFGSHVIAVPGGTQHFQTTVPMTYNDVSFEVQVEAGIRPSSGEVYATFQSIDPATGLPPPVEIGFLPPEDETGRGQGQISYTVRPKAGLPTGTEVRNVALIQFDTAAPIATNQVDPHDPAQGTDPAKECLNTIDVDGPVCTVALLATNDRTPALTVAAGDLAGVARVEVTVNGVTYEAVDNHDGTWTVPDDTISPPLADGVYEVAVTATDALGNAGSDATADELTIDTAPPAVTVNPLITGDLTPPLTGTVDDPAAAIRVTVGGHDYDAVNNHDGTWTVPDNLIQPPLAAGVYDVAVTATDAAGNVGRDATTDELSVFYQHTLIAGSWTFTDSDGDKVTVTLSGKSGSAEIARAVGSTEWGDILRIVLDNTGTTSNLTITARSTIAGKVAQTTIGGVTVNGSLAGLKAPAASLVGNLTVGGTLGALVLNEVSGAMIRIGGTPTTKTAVTLKFGRVTDTSLVSGMPVGSLAAVQWREVDGTPDTITAPRVGTLSIAGDTVKKIAGDFGAGLALSGEGVLATAKVLTTARVKGAVAPSVWDIQGAVGAVTLSGAVGLAGRPWELKNATTLGSLTLGDVADAVVTATGSAGAVKAIRWLAGSIRAAKIGSIATTGLACTKTAPAVSGDFGADLTLTETVKQTLGRLTVAGWLDEATIVSAGPLGTLTVGGIRDSRIQAGDAGVHTSLGRLTVQGIKGQTYSFINSNVSAWTLGTVSVKGVQTRNGSQAHGITGRRITTSYTRDGKRVAGPAVGPKVVEQVDDYIVELV